jgi:hypothetical protein
MSNTQAVKSNMLQPKSFKTICCSLLPNSIISPKQCGTPWVSLWYGDITEILQLFMISTVHWSDILTGWKPIRQNTLFLNGGSTVECTKSIIPPVHPIKAYAEVEVSLHSFWTSTLGRAWCLAVLTLGRESLVPNEQGGWQAVKVVWMPWSSGLLPLSEFQPQFLICPSLQCHLCTPNIKSSHNVSIWKCNKSETHKLKLQQ